ncbi:hypothetical protein H920_07087 [Fukomys damarensis]|uniref:Uncharacterized protein n=1 Tax=Fukomys damarensis TaxID=885580 RepID=A0A091DM65_FUKDA|nr:hypothetical protein H920_07087 [Fukomys damarensis]
MSRPETTEHNHQRVGACAAVGQYPAPMISERGKVVGTAAGRDLAHSVFIQQHLLLHNYSAHISATCGLGLQKPAILMGDCQNCKAGISGMESSVGLALESIHTDQYETHSSQSAGCIVEVLMPEPKGLQEVLIWLDWTGKGSSFTTQQ